MTREKLQAFFEENEFIVHLFEQDNEQCAELESWTKKGVNMIIPLCPFTAEEFIDCVELFDVGEHVDLCRRDEKYKKDFSIEVSVDDFNAYANRLDRVVKLLEAKDEPKHLYIRLTVQDGVREHTHHCVTSTRCENLEFAVQWYAAHFWGDTSDLFRENKDSWYYSFDGGEISVTVETWKELTTEEANMLNQLMY